MSLRIGETFAGYRILRLLGSGGMGEVYLVQHPRLPRQEALKVLRPDVSSDPAFRERFIREADLAAALRHPHVVGVHDRGEHDGRLWIAMDYIDGTDGAHLIEQRYPAGMPIDLAPPIVSAVASALDYAHKKGLLHRDVKPANILVADLDSAEPAVFLADFGIARPLDDTSGITTTNMTVGTVAYAAPEQLMGEPIDGRSDEYALAATAYHLLTGQQVFPHSNPAVVISRHLNSTPSPVSSVRKDLVDLDTVFAVALAKNPNDRFLRCTDFARALADMSSTDASAFHVVTTEAAPVPHRPAMVRAAVTPSLRHRTTNASRRRWLLFVTALAAAILLGSVAALLWHPSNKPSATPSTVTSQTIPSPPWTTSSEVPAPPPPPPPPPPVFPAKSIDSLLLSAAELTNLLGIKVSDNPGDDSGGLKLDVSSYGTSDRAQQVTPRSCAAVAFTAQHDVYDGSDFEAIKTESFSRSYGYLADNGQGPDSVEQTVAVFPSAELARKLLSAAQSQWNACAHTEVDVILGYENGRGFTLGGVHQVGDLMTVSMGYSGGETGPDACQQALGVRENVVVESRTCQAPTFTTHPGEPGDPDWAIPDAERLANAILEKATV